jgi:hypothetical protein
MTKPIEGMGNEVEEKNPAVDKTVIIRGRIKGKEKET